MDRLMLWRGHRKLWIATFLMVVLMCLATAALAYRADPIYTATSVIEVSPTANDVSTTLLAWQIPSLEVRTISPNLEDEVRAGLFANLAKAEWTVSTHVTPGSGAMEITVESPDPLVPQTVANAYAKALSEANLTGSAMEVVVISPAIEPTETSTRQIILITGFGLALIIPCLVALWIGTRDERLRTRELSMPLQQEQTANQVPTGPPDPGSQPFRPDHALRPDRPIRPERPISLTPRDGGS